MDATAAQAPQRGEADEARRTAAAVHRRARRLNEAIDLLAEAEAWVEVLGVMRDAETILTRDFSAADFGRWHRMLPPEWRRGPVALLAAGLALQPRAPRQPVATLQAAAEGFRTAGDADGEAAAIAAHGMVLWWENDPAGLLGLYERVVVLAEAGSADARFLAAVGVAAIAHLSGDSAGVFAALSEVDDIALPGWAPITQWFRSVAHRRDGNLERSLEALDAIGDLSVDNMDLELARLRTRWLQGDVEHVLGRLPALQDRYEQAGDRVNAAGTVLELAAKAAWLGDPDAAARLLDGLEPALSAIPGPMNVAMRLIAQAAVAVGQGDEAGAAALLHDDAIAMVGRPDGWYWRDRGAAALVHLLVPETRAAWAGETLGPPHRTALALAEVLEAGRTGDLGPAAALAWPTPGVVRASLPLSWVVELVAAGHAAGNSAPDELPQAIGSRLRPALRIALDTPGTGTVVGGRVRQTARRSARRADLPAARPGVRAARVAPGRGDRRPPGMAPPAGASAALLPRRPPAGAARGGDRGALAGAGRPGPQPARDPQLPPAGAPTRAGRRRASLLPPVGRTVAHPRGT